MTGGMDDHRAVYNGFIKGSIALTLICIFVLISLVSFAFGHAWSVFLGFAGLIIGIIAVLIDTKTGSKRYFLTLGIAVLFGLITAINVT